MQITAVKAIRALNINIIVIEVVKKQIRELKHINDFSVYIVKLQVLKTKFD